MRSCPLTGSTVREKDGGRSQKPLAGALLHLPQIHWEHPSLSERDHSVATLLPEVGEKPSKARWLAGMMRIRLAQLALLYNTTAVQCLVTQFSTEHAKGWLGP